MSTRIIDSEANSIVRLWTVIRHAFLKLIEAEKRHHQAIIAAQEIAALSDQQMRDAGIDPLSLIKGPVMRVEPGLMAWLMSMR